MNDLTTIEEYYKKYSSDMGAWLPEGIIEVDLSLLHSLDLLKYHSDVKEKSSMTRYFHLLETAEKITLINDQFIVWIVPETVADSSVTYILIALNTPNYPQLETVFLTSGIYNSSRLVLRILEKFLLEIQETEEVLSVIKNKTAL